MVGMVAVHPGIMLKTLMFSRARPPAGQLRCMEASRATTTDSTRTEANCAGVVHHEDSVEEENLDRNNDIDDVEEPKEEEREDKDQKDQKDRKDSKDDKEFKEGKVEKDKDF